MNKIKTAFFATPDIALTSFEYFINSSDYDMKALVTIKPKPQNRGNKIVPRNITLMAQKYNIPVFEPDKISKEPEIIDALKKMDLDFIVTFAFGQILSQEVIDIPKIATINLHASLLPQYRGANPIAQAIIDGNQKTGITTMKTVLALDAGDICLQDEINITPDMNVIELMREISARSPKLLDETLKGLYEGTLKTKVQDENKATFTKKLNKCDKLIDWNTDSKKLHDKIRGMYQINTNHTIFKNKIVKVLKTRPSSCCGAVCEVLDITKEGIVIGCKEGSLELLTIKPEGKGKMKASDWAKGARIKKGDKFI